MGQRFGGYFQSWWLLFWFLSVGNMKLSQGLKIGEYGGWENNNIVPLRAENLLTDSEAWVVVKSIVHDVMIQQPSRKVSYNRRFVFAAFQLLMVPVWLTVFFVLQCLRGQPYLSWLDSSLCIDCIIIAFNVTVK